MSLFAIIQETLTNFKPHINSNLLAYVYGKQLFTLRWHAVIYRS